ncbi:MAG: Crp/Fnr family transcriptional regulator [Woeseiaceae bacterium]|jgi:CRP/FNR family transcriptional regulator
MNCTNCECPFYELHSEDEKFSSTDLNCLVTDAVKQINFVAGEVLFTQGQTNSSLYSLSSGLIKITNNAEDGREQIVGLGIPGKLLVGLQSIDQDRHEYTAVAASDGSACKIRHRALLRALKDRGEIALRLIAALNAQLSQSRSLMEVMGHKKAAEKIAAFILLLAPGVQAEDDRFTLPFSRNDIADLLGLSEETVCRQMATMKRKGVIYAPRGKMRIQDWDQLRAIADGQHA